MRHITPSAALSGAAKSDSGSLLPAAEAAKKAPSARTRSGAAAPWPGRPSALPGRAWVGSPPDELAAGKLRVRAEQSRQTPSTLMPMTAYLRWIVLIAMCSAQLPLHAVEPVKLQRLKVPAPPWPAGDERGMANQLGEATTHALRLAPLAARRAHLRSLVRALEHDAEVAVRGPVAEQAQADRGRAVLAPTRSTARPSTPAPSRSSRARRSTPSATSPSITPPWDSEGSVLRPTRRAYYGGFKQKDVKPTPDSPLLKLGIEKIPPLVTTAVLLDAKAYVGKGQRDGRWRGGHRGAHRGMLKAQGLAQARHPAGRHGVDATPAGATTGRTPTTARSYYARRRGWRSTPRKLPRRPSASSRSGSTRRSSIRCPSGMLQGKAAPAPGPSRGCRSRSTTTCSRCSDPPPREPEPRGDGARQVWTSCAMVLPSRDKGAAGAVVRPVAIGAPDKLPRRAR